MTLEREVLFWLNKLNSKETAIGIFKSLGINNTVSYCRSARCPVAEYLRHKIPGTIRINIDYIDCWIVTIQGSFQFKAGKALQELLGCLDTGEIMPKRNW